MGALTVGKSLKGRNLRRQEENEIPSLLEFHSPTAALTVAPVQAGIGNTALITSTLIAACFLAAGLIPVDKVVSAQGKVVSESANSVVQPLETAIVRSIDVQEGQIVKKGELLARLDPTFVTADAGALQAQVDSLQTEVDRLTAETQNKMFSPTVLTPAAMMQVAIATQRRSERAFKMEGYSQKIAGLQFQIQRAMADVGGYRDRLKVALEVESKRMELERDKVGSALNRLSATDTRLEVQRGLDNATAQAAQGARDLAAMQAERDGYDQTWRSQVIQDLTDQGRKLSDARESLSKAIRRKQLVELTAAQDSIVLSIAKASIGSVLQSGEQLMSLTPLDANLEVEVNIPGADAGFVHPGNPVTIKFDAFPFTQYGDAEGVVRVVSPDSFTSSQNPDDKVRGVQQGPAPGGASYFRSRITLDKMKLHDTPAGVHLPVPGMPVTTDVKVGQRTVLSYLLSRVLPVAMDGMREP